MSLGPPKWVSRYVGIPFAELGYSLDGCHCWGLVWLVFKDRGIELPKSDTVTAKELHHFMGLIKRTKGIPPWHPVEPPYRELDVVLMAATERENKRLIRREGHVGLAVDHRLLLHVEKGTDSVCVPINHPTVRHRVLGAQRHEHFA